MPLQLRPKNDPDAPAYAPQRDLAYCFPDLVRQSIVQMASGKADSWLMTHMYQMCALRGGCSDKEVHQLLGDGCEAFAKGVTQFHRPGIGSPKEGLAEFLELPVPIQVAIMAKVGQMVTCAFFTGIRDVTDYDKDPVGIDLAALTRTAAEASASLNSTLWSRSVRWVASLIGR